MKKKSFAEETEVCQEVLLLGNSGHPESWQAQALVLHLRTKDVNLFFKVKNAFVHKIITSFFICILYSESS